MIVNFLCALYPFTPALCASLCAAVLHWYCRIAHRCKQASTSLVLCHCSTETLKNMLGVLDVSAEVAKLEGRIFQLYGANQVRPLEDICPHATLPRCKSGPVSCHLLHASAQWRPSATQGSHTEGAAARAGFEA